MHLKHLDILTAGTTWRNLIIVQLVTDEGLIGLGEATIEYGDRALIAYLPEIFTRAVRGCDPRDVDGILAAMVKADYWRSGFIARTAFSGIELACWDLAAKAEGKPVWDLLGNPRPTPLTAYANGWYRTKRDPEDMAEAARHVVEHHGYTAMKIDPFGAGDTTLTAEEFDLSIAIVRHIRAAVGDQVELFVEGHGRFDLPCATRLAKAMEPFRPGFFEEPLVPELNHHIPKLIEQTNITIALGERLSHPSLFETFLRDCSNLVLQPDLTHIGGIRGAQQVSAMANQRGWRVAPHNAGGPLATAHNLHFGITSPDVLVQETFDDFEDPWVMEAFTGSVPIRQGRFERPSSPGFGIRINPDVIDAHPFVDLHLDLFAEGWEQRHAEAMN